jgi:hypothetical protein
MAYNIVFDVTDFERSLGELINKFEKRAPLMKMLAGMMEFGPGELRTTGPAQMAALEKQCLLGAASGR